MWKFHSDFKPVDWMIAVNSLAWGIHWEENPQLTASQINYVIILPQLKVNTGVLLKTNTRFLYSSSTDISQPWMATRNQKCSPLCYIIITDFSFAIFCFNFWNWSFQICRWSYQCIKNNNIHLPVVVHGSNYLSVLKLPIYNHNIT